MVYTAFGDAHSTIPALPNPAPEPDPHEEEYIDVKWDKKEMDDVV